MSDILSQDELDALLSQVQQGSVEEAPGGDSAESTRSPDPADVPGVGDAAPSPPVDTGTSSRNLDLLLTIPVDCNVELGRTRMSIYEILQLGQGSVLELSRMASDLIELTVNGKVIAQGEAVVVNENFGFRVSVVDPISERLRKL